MVGCQGLKCGFKVCVPANTKVCVPANTINNDIIDRILSGREITPKDLTVFTYWDSYEEFDHFVSQFSYSNSQLNRLFAKAEIFFNMNFVVALERLYSAKTGALNEQELKTIQGEINALINFVRESFFSLESPIEDSQFVKVMEIANQKAPEYLPALLALIKYYLFIGDFTLVKNYIDSIPLEIDNQSVIALMNQKLTHTKEDKGETQGGIPMRKSGNHFVVKVNINNDNSCECLSLVLSSPCLVLA